MSMLDTMLSGRERHEEAFAEHTNRAIHRILNPGHVNEILDEVIADRMRDLDPQRAAATAHESKRAEQEGSSPRADLGTAEVSASQYRNRVYAYERLIDQLHDLMVAEKFDDAFTLVHVEYLANHGPRE